MKRSAVVGLARGPDRGRSLGKCPARGRAAKSALKSASTATGWRNALPATARAKAESTADVTLARPVGCDRRLRAAAHWRPAVDRSLVGLAPARAVEAVNVRTDAPAIDLTDAVERQRTEGDRIQVSTAPGPDGIVRRIEVRAREGGTNWAVFALANSGDEQIDRLIVVPHYRMVGSGLFWPDLGLSRVVTHHAELGRAPGAAGQRRPPTSSASRSIPARS